jgi:hypothetical protein
LQAAFEPKELLAAIPLERAVLTLLVEGHASYRGIQTCLAVRSARQEARLNGWAYEFASSNSCAARTSAHEKELYLSEGQVQRRRSV